MEEKKTTKLDSLAEILNEESAKQKSIVWIKNNINGILITIISLAFIVSAAITLTPKDDWLNIFITSALAVLVGWIIKYLFRRMGLSRGYSSNKYERKQDEYNQLVFDNNKDSEYYVLFCDIENENKLREYQTNLLATVNLTYTRFINGDYDNAAGYYNLKGELIPYSKAQLKVLYRVKNPKIRRIDPDYLTNETSMQYDSDKKEEKQSSYEGKRGGSNAISMAITGLLFGYFSVNLLTINSMAQILWNFLQILIYLVWGFVEYYRAFSWVVIKHYSYLQRRCDYLIKFKNMMNNPDSQLRQKINEIKIKEKGETENESRQ